MSNHRREWLGEEESRCAIDNGWWSCPIVEGVPKTSIPLVSSVRHFGPFLPLSHCKALVRCRQSPKLHPKFQSGERCPERVGNQEAPAKSLAFRCRCPLKTMPDGSRQRTSALLKTKETNFVEIPAWSSWRRVCTCWLVV